MENYIKIAKQEINGKAIETCIDLEIMAKEMHIELYWVLEEFSKAIAKEIRKINKGEN